MYSDLGALGRVCNVGRVTYSQTATLVVDTTAAQYPNQLLAPPGSFIELTACIAADGNRHSYGADLVACTAALSRELLSVRGKCHPIEGISVHGRCHPDEGIFGSSFGRSRHS